MVSIIWSNRFSFSIIELIFQPFPHIEVQRPLQAVSSLFKFHEINIYTLRCLSTVHLTHFPLPWVLHSQSVVLSDAIPI
jgi:hypothetical protein